jgi:hypothetical protein
VSEWIDVSERKPTSHEIVLVFAPPIRMLAQYCPWRGDECWNVMDGRYMRKDEVVIWAEIPPHPYEYMDKLEISA